MDKKMIEYFSVWVKMQMENHQEDILNEMKLLAPGKTIAIDAKLILKRIKDGRVFRPKFKFNVPSSPVTEEVEPDNQMTLPGVE